MQPDNLGSPRFIPLTVEEVQWVIRGRRMPEYGIFTDTTAEPPSDQLSDDELVARIKKPKTKKPKARPHDPTLFF